MNEMANICDENQKRFDEAYSKWIIDQSDSYWKIMWECVYFACMNHCKRLVKGLKNSEGKPIHIQDLDGKACEASIKIMKKIKEGVHPTLSAYPYLWCYGEIFGVKQQRWDQSKDFKLFENVAYYVNDDQEVNICISQYGE